MRQCTPLHGSKRDAGEPACTGRPSLATVARWLEEFAVRVGSLSTPWEPTAVTVNGRTIWPYALIDSFERGLAWRKPAER